MLFRTLGASLLSDLLTKNLSGKRTVGAGQGTIRAGYGRKEKALIPPHPLANFEIEEYYENGLDLMAFILEIIYLKH